MKRLRESAFKGVMWNAFGTVGSGVINIILTIILSRILSPSDFGIIELLIIFSIVSDSFVDAGFSQSLIREKEVTEKDLSTIFYFNLGVSLILYLLLYNLSPFIASYYDEPLLLWLSRLVFLTIIFRSLSLVQIVHFSRDLNFKPIALSSFIGIIIAFVITLFLANNNYGIWALAINLLLLPIFKSILLWYFSDWSPKLVFSISSLKRHLSFGSRLLIIGVFDKIVSNFESLLIGKYYSKIELGYFSQARKLNSYVVETSSIVLQRVTYPLLSKLGDNKAELKNGYRKVIEVSMFVIFPTMFFIYISSENIIISLFGEKWLDSAKYLRLWSICGLVITLYSFFINIFLVLSKTNLLLIISIIRQVLRLVMLFFVLKMDVISILYGITIVTIISGIIYIYIGGKFINYTFKEVFFDIKYILIFSILSSIITYFIGKYFILESNTLKLFIQIFSMTFMYFSLSMIFNSKPLLEVKFLLSNILGKK